MSSTFANLNDNLILAPFAHMQKTSATLLIIDDDEVVRASLAAYLEDSGFSVLQAGNGEQGLQVFERDQPDLYRRWREALADDAEYRSIQRMEMMAEGSWW